MEDQAPPPVGGKKPTLMRLEVMLMAFAIGWTCGIAVTVLVSRLEAGRKR